MSSSREESTLNADPPRFPRCTIYYRNGDNSSRPLQAWVFASSSLRWKYVSSATEVAPEGYRMFRHQNYLTVQKLPEESSWEHVRDAVKPESPQEGYALVINGKITWAKKCRRGNSQVKLIVVTENKHLRDTWVNLFRILITPWQLKYKILCDFALRNDYHELWLQNNTGDEGSSSKKNPSNLKEFIDGLSLLPDSIKAMFDCMSLSSFIVKICAPVSSDLANRAQRAADITKCVTIVGALFQLGALTCTIIDMAKEAVRASTELPKIRDRVRKLQTNIGNSFVPVLRPGGQVDPLLMKEMCKVQEKSMNILVDVEDLMMQGGFSLFFKATVLKKIEEAMVRLDDCVASVVQTREISDIKVELTERKEDINRLSITTEKHEGDISAIENKQSRQEEAMEGLTETVTEQKEDINRLSITTEKHEGDISAIENKQSRQEEAMEGLTETVSGLASTATEQLIEITNISSQVEDLKAQTTPLLPSFCERPMMTPYFVGRQQEIQCVKEVLLKFGSCIISQNGGGGKTQLAVAFAEDFEGKELGEGGAHWVRCHGNESRVVASLADFTEALTETPMMEKDRTDITRVFGRLKPKLKSMKDKWLLVLDNADDVTTNNVICELCRFAGDAKVNGWVVVTSRQGEGSFGPAMNPEQLLVLKPLEEEDSMVLLYRLKKNMLSSTIDVEQLREDMDESEFYALKELAGNKKKHGLAGHPLALVQAGTFMSRLRFGFTQYVQHYRDKLESSEDDYKRLFPSINDRSLQSEHQRTVWTTWKVNTDAVSEEARDVLKSFSFCDSSPVPQEVVKNLHSAITTDELKYAEVVRGELVNESSLLNEIESRDGTLMYTMHRLLHEFVMLEMEAETELYEEAINRTIFALHTYLKVNVALPIECFLGTRSEEVQVLLPHARSVLLLTSSRQMKSDALSWKDRMLVLYFFAIRALRFQGRTLSASELCPGLYSFVFFESPSYNSDIKQKTLYEMATIACENGKFIDANQWYKMLLDNYHFEYGKEADGCDIAACLHNLGVVAQESRSLDDAESHCRLSLEMKQRLHGKGVDHRSVAITLHQLGRVAQEKGFLDVAERWYRQSMEMKQRLYDEDADITSSLQQLGIIALKKGSLKDAERYYTQALQMAQRCCGEDADHLDVAICLHQLGIVAHEKGSVDDAERWYRQGLEMTERLHGENVDHPGVADSIHELGRIAQEKGSLDEAENLFRKSWKMRMRVYGENVDHIDVAGSLHQLGIIAEEKGSLDDAENWCTRSLRMIRRLYGEDVDHPHAACSLHQLGIVAELKGTLDDAEQLHHQSLKMKQRLYGKDVDHPSVTASLHQLGMVAQLKGTLDDAERIYHQSLEMQQRLYGKDVAHPAITSSFQQLAHIAEEKESLDEAESWYRKALMMEQSLHGEDADHPKVAYYLYRLGVVAQAKGNKNIAERLYSQALEMEQRIHGENVDNADTARALVSLGMVQVTQGERWGTLEEGKEMFRRLYGDEYWQVVGIENLQNQIALIDAETSAIDEE